MGGILDSRLLAFFLSENMTVIKISMKSDTLIIRDGSCFQYNTLQLVDNDISSSEVMLSSTHFLWAVVLVSILTI